MKLIRIVVFVFVASIPWLSVAQKPVWVSFNHITTGDEQTSVYFPMLRHKNVAVVANQSSVIGSTHLVDTLVASGIHVVRIFSPEHGFRGKAEAGEQIQNGKDTKTGIPIVSLYGKHRKPTAEDLKGVDVVLFDLQDVGVRFYTYISTLTLVMDACTEQHIPLIILDRPNPNAFYIDGPVLQKKYTSFVGMHPIPVIYGMTIGEYARMVNGEGWLKDGKSCILTVVRLKNYKHNMVFQLPVKPSPNLPNWQSVYLYPSLCFFEGTPVSVGRGTPIPFQVFGHPDLKGPFVFTPRVKPGTHIQPKLVDQRCYGDHLTRYAERFRHNKSELNLHWLIKAYKELSAKKIPFFTGYFDLLAGNDQLKKQIEEGKTEKQIRESWQKDLKTFEQIRKKYLLYH
ncbi:MAG: DUF1343 domain-containing protein [Bacteroidales bacterium]|nr:DUF1343 domain-containing protein [Bacteroidales bacterium]